MKVYVSADIEGISGVVSSTETEPLSPEWARARRLMMGEVNAAVEGALAAGATEIVVNDAHGTKKNLMVEDLNPAATLLSGEWKMYSMMAGLDSHFAAALFIGYHARVNSSHASVDHTFYDPGTVQGVWLNRIEVGEYGLNGALAGCFGVPVALVTGDQTVCAQAREFFGDHLETVVVKEAVSRTAAKILAPSRAQEMIRAAAERALKKEHTAYRLQAPITLRLRFARSSQADRAEYLPDSKRMTATEIEYVHDDYLHIFRAFYSMIVLGNLQA
jgi:D-amino peptidase